MKNLLLVISFFIIGGFFNCGNAEFIEQSFSFNSDSAVKNENPPMHSQNTTNNKKYTQSSNETAIKGFESVSTPNPANYNVKYLYYIPKGLAFSSEPFPVIVYIHGMGGNPEFWIDYNFYQIADEYGFGIIVPEFKFNEQDFQARRSFQYPAAWAGPALLKIADKLKSRGMNYSKFYLVGFSAGAQYVARFSMLYPDVTEACAILASGQKILPTSGNNVKYFYGVGINDESYRVENADSFYDAAGNLGISVELRKYSAAHEIPFEEAKDVADFFVQVKQGKI